MKRVRERGEKGGRGEREEKPDRSQLTYTQAPPLTTDGVRYHNWTRIPYPLNLNVLNRSNGSRTIQKDTI